MNERGNPEVTIIESRPDSLTFILDGTDTSVANALRRVMQAETPTLAIDIVYIIDNTTVLNDEFISHRLGLIPLNSTDQAKINFSRDCGCITEEGFCPLCAVEFRLDKTCTEEYMEVTSRDLISRSMEFPTVRPVDSLVEEEGHATSGIRIAKMRKGQRINLRAFAKKVKKKNF